MGLALLAAPASTVSWLLGHRIRADILLLLRKQRKPVCRSLSRLVPLRFLRRFGRLFLVLDSEQVLTEQLTPTVQAAADRADRTADVLRDLLITITLHIRKNNGLAVVT